MWGSDAPSLMAAVAAGSAGCLATILAGRAMYGDSEGKRAYLLQCILYLAAAVPLAFLDAGVMTSTPMLIAALLWLIVATSLIARFLLPGNDQSWGALLTRHSIYGFVTLAVYLISQQTLPSTQSA